MARKRLLVFLLLVGPLLLAGCNKALIEKSSNPLSPTIAGPIAGVTFTTAQSVQPALNLQIKYVDQPITFAFDAPTSTSPRPFTMRLQIATAISFATVVFDRGGLEVPTGGTRVTLRLSDRLAAGVYFWRVRAEDGANNSDWSAPSAFEALDRVVIGVPTPASPINNTRVTSRQPELTVNNSAASGPHKAVQYQFQVSTDPNFPSTVADAVAAEGAAHTIYVVPAALSYSTTYYWRARAGDGETISDWSQAAAFISPLTPPPAPTPGPGPGPGPGPSPTGGDWQSCGALSADMAALVACVHAVIQPGPDVARAFEVTKRVAWLLRGEGVGLLIKNGGENIIGWQGYSFAIGRVCYPDGHIYKVLTDVGQGGTNGPGWSDNGFVDKSLYVPAINPDLPEPEALPSLTSVLFDLEAMLAPPPAEITPWWLVAIPDRSR